MRKILCCVNLVTMFAGTPAAGQEVINVISGNGPVGGTDSMVTMLVGPANSGFTAPFGVNEFATAASGPPAVIPTLAAGWATLPGGSAAQWIATDPNMALQGSALYAINFTVTTQSIVAAFIDLSFLVDDFIGDQVSEGLYVNTMPVLGTSPVLYGAYAFPATLTGLDVTHLVLPGSNTLFLYGRDTGGPGGICFDATITVHGSAHVRELVPFTVGGVGAVRLDAGSAHAGAPYRLLVALAPALPGGSGIPLATGEVLLALNDPILQLLLLDPTGGGLLAGTTGTISPFNGSAVALAFLPPDPSLAGTMVTWQAIVFTGALPVEASNALRITIR